ncbi:MAG: hydroxyacid dehydrogenase [Saprospiraceae bacterium]|nr:hydroxyacid dehydrogenase [Saprospiraceae bacterium]
MREKVLITDDIHSSLLSGLEAAGFECVYEPNITDAQVRNVISAYVGLIINSKIHVDRAMLDAASRLRFVGRVGSGMEIVDRDYAAEKGVAVLSSPEGNRNAVAEHALGMLLSLANNLNRANAEVKNLDWQREKNRGFELRGKTIGIVGFGHTGSSFAVKLLGLGMRIMVYDKYLPPNFLAKMSFPKSALRYPRFSTEGVKNDKRLAMKNFSFDLGKDYDTLNYEFSTLEESSLENIQAEADIISFHLPLTPETKHLVNARFLKECTQNVILINTSRGNVIKTADLLAALKTGKVAGACLDVFENEKTATYTEGEKKAYKQLFSYETVIVSPHVAGWTIESKERLANILLKKILRFEIPF